MNEPAICLSVLGPSRPSDGNMQKPGTVNWSEGGTKMIAHIPFYILGEQEGKKSSLHFFFRWVKGITKEEENKGFYALLSTEELIFFSQSMSLSTFHSLLSAVLNISAFA
jgi:hypothetical protein